MKISKNPSTLSKRGTNYGDRSYIKNGFLDIFGILGLGDPHDRFMIDDPPPSPLGGWGVGGGRLSWSCPGATPKVENLEKI